MVDPALRGLYSRKDLIQVASVLCYQQSCCYNISAAEKSKITYRKLWIGLQVAAIAAMCVQPEPDYRPLMTDVVQSLIPLVKNLS